MDNLEKQIIEETIKAEKAFDAVNRPSHYCEGRKYEPIAVIQDWGLDFCLGNTIKYISRAGRKTSATLTDIEKELHINSLEELGDAYLENIKEYIRK